MSADPDPLITVLFKASGSTLREIEVNAMKYLGHLDDDDEHDWTLSYHIEPEAETGDGSIVLWTAEVEAIA